MAKFKVADNKIDTSGDAPDPTTGATGATSLVSALQESITAQSGAVSSAQSGVEAAISGAIQSTRAGTEAETARIESQFGRGITRELGEGADRVQNFAEARGGFATQLTGLRRLVETTDKNLNDLEQRKQELILQNNSAGAAQITALQMKQLEFKLEAEQNVFNNLLSASSFGLQALGFEEGKRQFEKTFEFEGERFQLQKDQQSFEEDQAIGSIALEFGLDVADSETIDSIIDRAAGTGIVDERRKIEMEQIRASINASNAQAAKALRKDPGEQPFDDLTKEILAKAFRDGNTEFLAGLKTNEQLSSVIGTVDKLEKEETTSLEEIANQAGSPEEFLNTIADMTAGKTEVVQARINRLAAGVAATTEFTAKVREPGRSLPQIVGGGLTGFSEGTNRFLEFLTGIERTR